MTKNVRNRASPVSTWLDGVVAMPSAWRNIDNTMMIRVNAVIASKMAGNRVSTVIKIRIWNVKEYDWAPSAAVLMATAGSETCAVARPTGSSASTNAVSGPTASSLARHPRPRALVPAALLPAAYVPVALTAKALPAVSAPGALIAALPAAS